jgi:hypothetical protein
MMWWRDVLNIVADEVAPLVNDFYARVNAAVEQHGVEGPEALPQGLRAPLEEEAHRALRVREAAAAFDFEL